MSGPDEPPDRGERSPDWGALAQAVRRMVRGRMRSGEVDDVVQVVLLELIRRRRGYVVRDWLGFASRLVRDACRLRQRRAHRRPLPRTLGDRAGTVPAPELDAASLPATWRAHRWGALAARAWIRDRLAPALQASPHAGGLSVRQRQLLARLSTREEEPASIRQLAAELGCDPKQVRRDLDAIARVARLLGPACPPPPLKQWRALPWNPVFELSCSQR